MCTILTVVAILEKVLFHAILALVKGQLHHQNDSFLYWVSGRSYLKGDTFKFILSSFPCNTVTMGQGHERG